MQLYFSSLKRAHEYSFIIPNRYAKKKKDIYIFIYRGFIFEWLKFHIIFIVIFTEHCVLNFVFSIMNIKNHRKLEF